jgi:hypothetical protein
LLGTNAAELVGSRLGLQAEQGHYPFSPRNIEMMRAKDFDVPQLIPQTQLAVGLKLVSMAGVADTLKVFPAVWIPCPQSSDQNRTKFGAGSGEREASDTRSARA